MYHVTQPFRPTIMGYKQLCDYLISSDMLEDILELYPGFVISQDYLYKKTKPVIKSVHAQPLPRALNIDLN